MSTKAKKPKQWKLPQEINDLFAEAQAMDTLRDKYIARPFGFKKAAKAATLGRIAILKAWRMARELYPDSADNLTWIANEGALIETPAREVTP